MHGVTTTALSQLCSCTIQERFCILLLLAESGEVEKHVFVRRAQEALSVARVRGNGYVWKQGLQAMAYGGGRCYQTGLDRPTEEVG